MTDNMPKMEMLPCPFCNGEARCSYNPPRPPQRAHGFWRVLCMDDQCPIGPHNDFDTEAEAIAAWNRRPPASGRGDVIEEAAAKIEEIMRDWDEAGFPQKVYACEYLAQAIRALKTAQPASPSAWLPISSAPKDGTLILLANASVVSSGHHWSNANRKHPRDRWVWNGWPQSEPTHWQPLPSPPGEVEQKQAREDASTAGAIRGEDILK